MKRTPLLFLLCLFLLFLSLFHFQSSNAKNEASNAVLVHENVAQESDTLRPVSQEVTSSKSPGANFERQELPQSSITSVGNPVQDQKSDVIVVSSYQNDTSIPLRKIKPRPLVSKHEREANENPKIPVRHKDSPDPVVQDRIDVLTSVATPNMPSPTLNFDGIPFPGVACNCAPPDTNGEVGATQYVQIANEGFQVFNKTTGASQFGPAGISTIWSGFGGPCETAGSGDPVVLYDQFANRWLISQFAGGPPTDECVAVSTTSDATGSYYRYAFHLGSNFFDYPKLAVWPDAYYMAMNVFNSSGSTYLGPQPFAFDRAKMLAGLPATFITTGITGGSSEATYLPADLDGSITPAAGSPATFVQWPGTGTYRVFHFHVDFANPLNSSFTLFASPPAAGFTSRTSGIPQLGTTSLLDHLGDRLMFRAATRFFPDGHESLVSNFTVDSGGVAAVRWFELRNPTQGPVTVFQQGTYQPDTTHRWMGSAAMDQQGNLAVGYSASSSAINPQIRYAGRLVGDPLNTLPQAEVTLFAGTGSQVGSFNRWGDYSAMTIDPVDDCTFWYTQEYYGTTSSFNWRTRIGAFKFQGCGAPVTQTLTVGSTNPTSGVNITVSPNDNSGLGNGATPFNRTYNLNTNVALTAPATAGGNNFQKWQRNGVDFSFNQSTTVAMDADYTLTAIYVTPTRTLTVASANPASGVSITVSPNDNSGLGNGATPFNRTYNLNTNVTLTAPATAGGNDFQKWQRNGTDWSTNRSTSVIMDANYTMTAVYVTPTRTLTVGSENPNSGVSITVSPNDNSNLGSGATPFSRIYNLNTIVTLTAPASAGGNAFYKWQRNGVDFSINPTVSLTMNSNYTMTAVYGTRTLTISSNPNSGVSITVTPNDTNNQGNGTTGFSRIYNVNTIVTLTTPATAGANIFQKWQRNGVDFSFTQSISVTMDHDYQLMAVYVSPPASVQTLSVAVSKPPDSPNVSITVSPNDNNNQGSGTAPFNRSYNHNTTVTLTAQSSIVSPFRKWLRNGLDWSTNLTTTVTMDSNYTMTAVYGSPIILRTLNVASTNPSSGVSINLFPRDLNNQGLGATQFSRTYSPSTIVTLAAPATVGGNTFQKWQRNGVDFSTNPIVDVTLDVFTVNMTAVYVGGGGSFRLGPDPALANPGGGNMNWTSAADQSTADWIALFRTGAVSMDHGAPITVNWTAPGNHPIVDLIALFGVGHLASSPSTSNTFPPAHQDRCFSQRN